MKTLQELKKQYGDKGLEELSLLDLRSEAVISRLYMLTQIAVNINKLNLGADIVDGNEFFKRTTPYINTLMEEVETTTTEFVRMRGEM